MTLILLPTTPIAQIIIGVILIPCGGYMLVVGGASGNWYGGSIGFVLLALGIFLMYMAYVATHPGHR